MRAKFQILVLLFKRINDEIYYCVFKRSDMNIYQFLSGGGEDDESIFDAAKRETFEESGVVADNFIKLETEASIRKDIFKDFRDEKGFYVIKEHSFACELKEPIEIKLSDEHTEFHWKKYDDVMELLKYDSNKTALWELRERIKENDL